MNKITATSLAPCQNQILFGQLNRESWNNNVKLKKKKQELQYHATKIEKRSQPLMVENQTVKAEPDYYSSRTFTEISLSESPWALVDQYLEDKSRVFKALSPDEQRSKRLNEDEWRIHMLPIEFLSLTINSVVDMRLRCKRGGKDYPPEVPQDIAKVLEFDMEQAERSTRDEYKLCTSSLACSDSQRCSIDVAESVLKRLEKELEHKLDSNLLADYSKLKEERIMHGWIWRFSKLWDKKRR